MEKIKFASQQELYKWLKINHTQDDGLWIIFDKRLITSTLKAEEALDMALCFGWIDGLIKKVDEQYYIKYFKKRLKRSIWSEKNKLRALELIKDGLMEPSGFNAIEQAKKNGQWEKTNTYPNDYNLPAFIDLIKPFKNAYLNFINMSNSVQKTYALSYYTLKKAESRKKRLEIIIDRLYNNLKPM